MKRRVLALASVLALIGLSAGLAACGGSETTTVIQESPSSSSSSDNAQLETLTLEKEKAENEAQKAMAEARKEAEEVKREAKQAAAQAEPTASPEPEPEPEEVPNVVGMRLPEAKSTLSAAGYSTQAENTDTTFGIVVPSHYTICTQSEPHGNVVTVLAQKYGC
jgi:beta-lactam-binding protein with PASTA domain